MCTSLMRPFHHLRSDVSVMETHLISLRRHAEALSGSRDSADAHVAAIMDILDMDRTALPLASSAKVGLFKLYSRLYATLYPLEAPAQVRARQILLLVLMEGFSIRQVAEILETAPAEIVAVLKSAGCTRLEAPRTGTVIPRSKARSVPRVADGPPVQALC